MGVKFCLNVDGWKGFYHDFLNVYICAILAFLWMSVGMLYKRGRERERERESSLIRVELSRNISHTSKSIQA